MHAWAGGSLLVTDARGSCGSLPLSGYYFRETRHLSRLDLLINGERPWLCESVRVSPRELRFLYVYPEVAAYGGGGSGQSGDDVPRDAAGIPQRALIVQTDCALSPAGMHVRMHVANHSQERVAGTVAIEIDADFADIQEAQGRSREQAAKVAAAHDERALVFEYRHPQLPRSTAIVTPPAGAWDPSGRRLTWTLALDPGAARAFDLSIEPRSADPEPDAAACTAHVARWRDSFARVTCPSNRQFEAVLAANVDDLASLPLLHGPQDEWLALQAGMPLYPAFFGRDAVTVGWQAAMLDGGQALDAALTRLGRHQGQRDDDWRDEQPGRIPYQMRLGPLARLNLNPYEAYYADFASPLMFVIALANLFAWTGDSTALDRHWDTARRILDWARDRGDRDGDGYLEYVTRSSKGTKNQGWKDSGDAIVYDDGRVVEPPIATCELQGYWYAAQQLMALLCMATGATGDGRAYVAAADDLKARFNRDWWSERDQFYALAMDPAKRLIGAPSSNVGHCLAAGIIDRSRLHAVVGRLFAPDLFSGWGVRTLTSGHSYYDPLSYHRGSVWAVEQGDDPVRPSPVRLRRAGARSGRGALRSRPALSAVPHSGDHRRVLPRRAADAGCVSAGERAAALERVGLPVDRAVAPRHRPVGGPSSAHRRSDPAAVAARRRRARHAGRRRHRDAALLAVRRRLVARRRRPAARDASRDPAAAARVDRGRRGRSHRRGDRNIAGLNPL